MENIEIPVLSAEETRVLGCLLEKSKTTPDYYPLTLNSLTTACNQKSSRNPVVKYSEETVMNAVDELRKKGLVGTMVGGGSRTTKFKHNMQLKFSLGNDDLAILCLLMLRGPLTSGEINSNSGRLYDFENLEEVNQLLEKLMNGEPSFVKQIGRKPGQKENRFVHNFMEYDDSQEENEPEDFSGNSSSELKDRVEKLEVEMAEIKAILQNLMDELS